MFIEVRYGHNETIICNPYCIVVNLMKSIKDRTGFSNERHMILDLSDVTGLVKDLDLHRLDKADKFLTTQGPYILVEKRTIAHSSSLNDTLDGDSGAPSSRATSPMLSELPTSPPKYNFIPLLDDCEDLFPEYKLRAPKEKKLKKPRHVSPVVAKSPSPAGKKVKKKVGKKK